MADSIGGPPPETAATAAASPSPSRAGSPVSLGSAGSAALLGAEVIATRDISKVRVWGQRVDWIGTLCVLLVCAWLGSGFGR
jgi:hypothetical protein